MNQPLVSVVIVTRNRSEMVRQCLYHLQQQDYDPFEIIVVDGSSNNLTEQIVRQEPTVQYIFLPDGKNRMTQARNLGIMAAAGQIVAFIDDDSMVTSNWLTALTSSYHNEDIGGVGGRVLDPAELKTLNSGLGVGQVLPDGRLIDNFATETSTEIEVDRLKGCNMSFRKDVLEEVGLFDNFYRTLWDDVDICTKIRKAGYRLLFNPHVLVNHLLATQENGLTRSADNPQATFLYYRNRTYFVVNNSGWWGQHLVSLFFYDTVHQFYLFWKNPSWSKLNCLLANIQGKLVAILAALYEQLKHNTIR